MELREPDAGGLRHETDLPNAVADAGDALVPIRAVALNHHDVCIFTCRGIPAILGLGSGRLVGVFDVDAPSEAGRLAAIGRATYATAA
jgi:hypothetical protein